ncbi:YcnI family copper-binding membrane protein [Arthrobacter pityocampae]|uniref:YcnI family copper-binding membrane protein n=1 Tax=Arthrobacter pityocampae TaxID=547334 RepID=UPI003736DFCE
MHASLTTALPTGPSSNDAAFTGTGAGHRAGSASRPARRTLRGIAALAATSGLLLAGAGVASAHVSVDPASTTEGGYSQLTFSVPSESTDTTTNKIEVALPTETPFTSVRVKPVEGWTSEVIRGDLPKSVEVDGATLTEAPLTVIWTADDEEHQLTAQQYQTFSLSVGTLPEAGTTVELPVTQSYADGTVRVWDEPAVEGEEEPENPAPSFITTASEGTDSHGAASAEATDKAAAGTSELETEQAAARTDTSGTVLGWVGLSAGVLGLLVGALALARTRGQRQN